MKQQRTPTRCAFTLIETVISLSIVSVLFLGLSGAVMIATHAIPTAKDTGLADQTVIDALNMFRSDLKQSSIIQYRVAASDIEFTLTIKNTGATGQKNTVIYSYIDSTKSFERKADAQPSVVLFDKISGFTVAFTKDGTDVTVVNTLISVTDTIQPIFEVNAILPDEPELQ